MFGSVTLIWLFCIFCQWFMAKYKISTSGLKYWTKDTVYQIKIKSNNIKVIFPASGGRAEMVVCGFFQSRGFLLILYRERQTLKTNKVLVKPPFNKSERVTDWSDLMISCFTSYIPFTLDVFVIYVHNVCNSTLPLF